MANYEKLYHLMFNAVTDALKLMETKDYGEARELLKKTQIKAEDLYIASEEENDEYTLKLIK